MQQRLGRDPQHRLEKIHSGVAPKRLIQPLAKSDPRRRRVTHRRCHQLRAAKLQEAAVADAMACRPFEDADRIGVGYPLPQHLAGLVPVDQEDQRCTDGFEKGVAALAAVERIAAGDQIESGVIGQGRRALALEPAPLHRDVAEQSGEELGARQMIVRIDDGHRVGFDGDDHDMGIGFSDVVLNRQPPAGPRCRRPQSGMAELELLRRLHPAHERFDRRPVFRQQRGDMRAREYLLRVRGRQPVQRFVQIHDQAVQAVAAALGQAGQAGDFRKRDIVGGAERHRRLDRREALGRAVALHRVAGFDGADHGLHVVPDRSSQAAEPRRRKALAN